MGREIEVQTDALISLSRDYRRYGQNIYSKYRSGSSRIESELSSILRKYPEYSSVTSKVYSIQSKLRETEQYIKRLEEKSNKISMGLTEAAKAYTSSEQDAKQLLNNNKLRVDGLGGRSVTTNVSISTKVVSKKEESIGDKIGNLWDNAVDKIKDVVDDATDFVTNFDLSATISGISKKFQDTVSNIKEKVSDVVTHIQTKVSDFADKVKGNVISFASGVKDKWDDFTSGVGNFFKKAKDTLADFGEKLLGGMKNIVDRFSQVVGDTIDFIIERKDDIINGLKKVGVFLLDGTQFVLDILGLIPGVGELADAVNGLIYLARGDLLNAGLSFAACIPFAGWAATGGKIVGKIAKVIDKIGDVSKIVDKVKDVGKVLLKYGDDALKFVMKKGDNVINFLTKKGNELWNFISNSKIYNKVDGIISVISKKGEDIQNFLVKQGEKISLGMKEWWEKQLRMGILPPEIASWINRGMGELGEEVAEEIGEEIVEEVIEKEVKEEIVEELAERAFKDIDFKDIEKVVEEGDILKVKLKDGTEISYKKADLSADELKKLEDSKLIVGEGKAGVVEYGEQYDKIGNKKVLKSNVEYIDSNGYKYVTDDKGRISNVQGNLQLGEGVRNEYAQRTVGGVDRLPTDDGGHLIGSQFNGSGQIDNLVPQNSSINRAGGEWYKMEKRWADALKEGSSVNVNITPIYEGGSVRPSVFKVDYWIDGEKISKKIINP